MGQLDEVAAQLEAAFNARDPAALASLYSETAILMPPNEPMVRGRAAIQAWFERALAQVLRSVRIAPIESVTESERAFQAGIFTTGARTDAASGPTGEQSLGPAGKYVLVLTRQAGHWRIQYDIWSLDQP